MERSLRLGRVAGITVGLNWSLLVVVWILCWSLATDLLPYDAPGYAAAAYWTAAVVGVTLFFSSLVAHELGHSLVARRHGVEVREITLWMLGGVAKLENEPPSAGAELRIAVAGPAVSVVAGVGFGAVAVAADGLGAPPLVLSVLVWLATINVVLAVFNLIPAFPTDGDRVLRAWLWHRDGDLVRATREAAGVGRAFGWGLVLLGVFAVTSGAGVGGLWFAFIGVFLVFASGMEEAARQQQTLLAGVRVADVMTPHPITAPVSVSVQELLDTYVLRFHVSAYPLVDPGGRVEGLATLAHVRRVPPHERATTPVAAVARPVRELVVAAPGQALVDILPALSSSPKRRALVVEGGALVGILSISDVSRALEVADLAGHPVQPAVSR